VRFGIVAMCSPRDHPRISAAEIDYLQKGGALVDMDRPKKDAHITESELELDNVEQADVEPAVVKSADVLPNSADETPK
jgi:ACS family glucarate transporter-like MFS transporter